MGTVPEPFVLGADRVAGHLSAQRLAAGSARPSWEQKIHAPSTLAQPIAALARPLVFTNGVFDLLHRGHVSYLAQARALGASLVVALNDDASVRGLGKGPERPINALEDRLAVIAALESVDLVTWFTSATPLERIQSIRPDILVKGGDWSVQAIVGAAEVLGWGGAVVSIPFAHQRSTTELIRRVRASE